MASSRFEANGFDKLRFTTPVPENFECMICKAVPREPRQCRKEHMFCLDCISESLKSDSKCPGDPECEEELTLETVVPIKGVSVLIGNLYDSLTLKCVANETGCKFIGTIQEVNDHEKTCDFALGDWRKLVTSMSMKIIDLEAQLATLNENPKRIRYHKHSSVERCPFHTPPRAQAFATHLGEPQPHTSTMRQYPLRDFGIIVKKTSGKRFAVKCKPSETIEVIKTKIEGIDGLARDQQVLIFGDRQLEDGQTLESYNIQSGSFIFLS